MSKLKRKQDSELLVEIAIKGLQEKKAKDIVCLDLREVNSSICDYFIICHGDSTTHVDALAGSVEQIVRKELGEKPWHAEGYENAQWILLDYVNVVVHIFLKDVREFYNIEGLWADAGVLEIESVY